MTLRNGRCVCVAGALAWAAVLAIGTSQLLADEYPVLAEWTQGKRVDAEALAPATVDLSGMILLVSDEEEKEGGGYWIGIYPRIFEQGDAEQPNKDEPRGVVVNRVIPESPAAKAKLLEGDIIVAAGDKDIKYLEELSEFVMDSDGKPIKLKVLRDGQEMHVEVKPARRGERRDVLIFNENEDEGREKAERREKGERRAHAENREQGNRHEAGEVREQRERMIRQLRERQMQANQNPARAGVPGGGIIYRPQPGMPGAPMTGAGMLGLPDDMQVTIQKRGNRPAKVTVKQGDKLWQTTENELGMLPPQSLGYVSRLLGRPMMPGRGGFGMTTPGGFTTPGMAVFTAPTTSGLPMTSTTAIPVPDTVMPAAPGVTLSTVPGAALFSEMREGQPGQPQRFEVRFGVDGQAHVVQGQGALNSANPGPPEGVRFKIMESGDNDKELHQLKEQLKHLRRELEERNNERRSREEKSEEKKERE